MYILIHNSKGSFSIDLPESFKQINIVSIYSSEEENDGNNDEPKQNQTEETVPVPEKPVESVEPKE